MAGRRGLKELKRITITDAEDSNKEEQQILTKITEEKIKNSQGSPAEANIADLIKQNIQSAMASFSQQKEEDLQKQKELFAQQLEQIKQQQQQEAEKYQQQLKEASEVIEQTKTELSRQQEAVKNFESLFKLTGSTIPTPSDQRPPAEKQSNKSAMGFPYVNTQTTTDSDVIDGRFGECIEIIDQEFKSGRAVEKKTEQGGRVFDFDKRPLDSYVRQNRKEVIQSLDQWGRKQGWFKGTRPIGLNGAPLSIKQAATTKTDLPGGFLETLSSIIRVWHRPGFIWHQFPQYAIDYSAGRGTNILVPRFALPTSSDNLTDYELSGAGTYATLSTNRDNVTASTVPGEVIEYGRGKSGTSINPFMSPKFTEYYSAYNLIEVMNQYLGIDYARFEDKKLRSLIDATSRVIYNDGNGALATAANALNTGDDGRFTKEFLQELQVYFHMNQIEPLMDGCWHLALNPVACKQLKQSYDKDWEASTTRDLEELLSIMNPSYLPDISDWRVNGYIGKVEMFHVFESNAWGVGAAGTDGAQNETLGGSLGNKLTRTSYAFGAGCTGRGISMPFEIRLEEGIDFNRGDAYTWLSWEAFVPLDVDPTGYSNTSQQLRAVEIHTLDVAV